jgi:tetratricopeptide (TPR) repeat protein
MVSACSLIVSLAVSLASCAALAQETKVALSSKPFAAGPAISDIANPPLTPERRGDILMARKMYREAIELYSEAPQDSAVVWNKMGIAYHQMNNLGTIYYAEKRYGKATQYYKRALRLAPESASIYSNLGTAYFTRRKYKEAAEAYDTAVKLDPEIFEHHSTYGVLLQETSVAERAKFHFYLAKTYAKAGQNERALQYIRKALEEGFAERKRLLQDPEFTALRNLPEFKELLALEPRVL